MTIALTLAALAAFAANSLLTRAALAPSTPRIDATAFTFIRLASGAVVLSALVGRRLLAPPTPATRAWLGPLALFLYAAPFTFAYRRIGAAMGALLLFGTVQLTMLGWGVLRGERLRLLGWLGVALAFGGLLALLAPATARPDVTGSLLMVLAGAAWGVYSLLGRGTGDALATNAWSFVLSVPCAAVLALLAPSTVPSSRVGVALAIVSGAVTSGLGYAIWYRALRGLTATRAAVVQVSVPVVAALGGVVTLGEPLSLRLTLCGALVLSGILLVVRARG
jgi:drug/metabolite transporter (DMT)-like permease